MTLWPAFLLILLAVFVALELWCLRVGRDTLSLRVLAWTRSWPILPFLLGVGVGVVAGHWWWPL